MLYKLVQKQASPYLPSSEVPSFPTKSAINGRPPPPPHRVRVLRAEFLHGRCNTCAHRGGHRWRGDRSAAHHLVPAPTALLAGISRLRPGEDNPQRTKTARG